MTRKNKTKGKKAKNGGEAKKTVQPVEQPPQPAFQRKDEFLGFVQPTELHHAEIHYNEQKRQNYVPPATRIALPKAPECARLNENDQAEMFEEIEKLTYPLPATSVCYAEYLEYRKQVKMHGVKTDEELISIINWNTGWLDVVTPYISRLEDEIFRVLPKNDPDFMELVKKRTCRETYMSLRKENRLEEDLFRTRRYMTNYLDKPGVEAVLTEPYIESVDAYLKTHPAEARWMLGFTRCIYFSDYTRLLPSLFSGPAIYFESKLVSKYGQNLDENLLIEADMIRYERDQHIVQMSICRRWLVARMIALRPKYLTGGMNKYLANEPNAEKSAKLKLAYELINSSGVKPSPKELSKQLKEYMFNSFKKETGVDYKEITIDIDDTEEEIRKKEELKESLLAKFDPEMMADALDAMMKIKGARTQQ